MNNCILCTKVGKKRRYFFQDAPLCDADYASYLEYLVDDMEDEVTAESARSAFEKHKITLEPKPAPVVVKKEDKKPSKARRSRMRM